MAGRPTKLTPEVQERIVEALRMGNTRKAAVAYGGVDFQTFLNWLAAGEKAKSGQFFEFFDLVTRAEAECEIENVAVLKKAAKGWKTKTTRTKTVRRQALDSSGKPITSESGQPLTEEVTETVTTSGREFDWRASLEWLKRRRRAEWGDNVSVELDNEITELMALLAGEGQAKTAGGVES